VSFSTPSKKRWMISPSPDFGSASDQTRKPSSRCAGAGNHHDALQVQRQEIAAVPGPLALEGELGDLGIGQCGRQFVQRAQAGDVREWSRCRRRGRGSWAGVPGFHW
jgi:hypothetical protein